MKIQIKKELGKLTDISREILEEKLSELPDGRHLVESKVITGSYTPTRYKYYFDCIMWLILQHEGDKMLIIGVGKERKVSSTKDVHEVMKHRHNSITIVNSRTGEVFQVARSTTNLSDRDFIGKYTEQIIMEYAGDPYYIDFPTYEEWKALHKARKWNSFKDEYLTTI